MAENFLALSSAVRRSGGRSLDESTVSIADPHRAPPASSTQSVQKTGLSKVLEDVPAASSPQFPFVSGGPEADRTPDPLIKSKMLFIGGTLCLLGF